MAELYKLFADQSSAETLMFLFAGLLFLAVALYKYDIMKRLSLRPTGFDKALIYITGGIALFCGFLVFGKLIFPDNVESLLEVLGLKNSMRSLTFSFQEVVLSIIGLLL